MSVLKWNIGVCSWSVGNNIELLRKLKHETDISTIHLHVRPDAGKESTDFIDAVLNEGWQVSCGMVSFVQEDYSTLKSIKDTGGIVPTEYWQQNKRKVIETIDILSNLGVKYLSFHFGFLDVSNHQLPDRVNELAEHAQSKAVTLLMETGQETANELKWFLEKLNHTSVGVNFDPANMILYGKGCPVEALGILGPWVKHVHLKDAIASEESGEWGREVPWSTGQVNNNAFLEALKGIDYEGGLCVEREQGSSRIDDVLLAINKVESFIKSKQ